MSTKHKVVIIAFVILVSLLLLIYFFGGKPTNMERFADEDGDYWDDFENDDEEKPKKDKENKSENKEKDKPKTTKSPAKKEKFVEKTKKTDVEDDDTSIDDSKPIDVLNESMNYLNSLNLPFKVKKDTFTQLFNDKGFSVLEKYSSVDEIKDYVSSVVSKVTGKLTPPSKIDPKKDTDKQTKETYEDFQDIKQQLSSLNKALAEISSTIEHFEKATEKLSTIGKGTIPKPSTATSRSYESKTSGTIEGFENGRCHYASIY